MQVDNPVDDELEVFIDLVDKVEEVVLEIASSYNFTVKSEAVDSLN